MGIVALLAHVYVVPDGLVMPATFANLLRMIVECPLSLSVTLNNVRFSHISLVFIDIFEFNDSAATAIKHTQQQQRTTNARERVVTNNHSDYSNSRVPITKTRTPPKANAYQQSGAAPLGGAGSVF